VTCCQILNLETKKAISQTIANNKEYSKCNNLAFIQASDFHGAEGSRPGAQHTIFDYDNRVNFKALKHLLRNQSPELSSEKIDSRYKAYIKGKILIEIEFTNSICITSESVENYICENFCTFLNTENSIFQVNLYNTEQDYNEAVDETIELLKNRIFSKMDPPTTVPFRVLDFSFSSFKKRLVFELKPRIRLFQFDGNVFLNDGEVNRIAYSSEIESIVARNSYNVFYKRKERILSETLHEMSIISKSFNAQSLRYRIGSKLKPLDFGMQIQSTIAPNFSSAIDQLLLDQMNGSLNGDCYVIEEKGLSGGRYNDSSSYLRFSCPKFLDSFDDKKNKKLFKTADKSIVVSFKGGVYYIDKALPLFSKYPAIEFKLDVEEEFDFDILLGFVGFLKSNFFLWHTLMFFETDKCFSIFYGRKPPIFIPVDLNVLKNISELSRKILNAENEFLRKFVKIRQTKNRLKMDEFIENHNGICNDQLHLIEREIFSFLNLSKDDYRYILSNLKQLGYYTYDLNEKIEEMFI
jgi:hypothetical protein